MNEHSTDHTQDTATPEGSDPEGRDRNESRPLTIDLRGRDVGSESKVLVYIDDLPGSEHDCSQEIHLEIPTRSQRFLVRAADVDYVPRGDITLFETLDLGNLVPIPKMASPVGTDSGTGGKPAQHAHEGILKTDQVVRSGNAVGLIPQTALPTNRVLERVTFRYFDLQDEDASLLDMEDGWIPGVAIDYEVSRESAGWALDDWIGTRALAPYQDTALADSSVATTAGRSQQERLHEHSTTSQADDGSALGLEDSGSRATASSTGFGANLGVGDSSESQGTDPVTKLVRTVTGAVQMGADWSHGRSTAEQQSTLARVISERFQRDLAAGRDGRAAASAQTSGAISDSRSLSAVRNPTGKSLNLATFSVAHQWRIATVVADCQPVVYIPIDRLNQTFTVDEVFLNYAALESALLEESLRESLKTVAATCIPGRSRVLLSSAKANRADQTDREVKQITGTVTFSDPARGQGSTVEISVTFSDQSEETTFGATIRDTSVGSEKRISIPVNRPLNEFGGTSISFINPPPEWDSLTVIKALHLDAELTDGTTVPLHDVHDIEVRVMEHIPIARTTPTTPPPLAHTTDPSPEVARLLAHLNHRRAYYRLAIDLQMDAATRFARLRQRLRTDIPQDSDDPAKQGDPKDQRVGLMNRRAVIPVGFDPVGVVGGHLAFRTARTNLSEGEKRNRGLDAEPKYFLASSPSAGTFTETLTGSNDLPLDDKASALAPKIPSGPKDSNVTYPWPDRVQPTEAAIDKMFTSGGSTVEPGQGPKVPPSPEQDPAIDPATNAEATRAKQEKAAKEIAEAKPDSESGEGEAGDEEETETGSTPPPTTGEV